MYPSPLKGINSTVLSKSQTWMTAATQQRVLNKEELLLERYPNVSWSLLRRGKSSQQETPALRPDSVNISGE